MNYTNNTVYHGTVESGVFADISLPCFTDSESTVVTARLNRFMSELGGMLYTHAAGLSPGEARSTTCVCEYEVLEENGRVIVKLFLTARWVYRGRKSEVVRKIISITFKHGYAVKKCVSTD